MRRSKLISLPLSLALATSSFATGFGASAESNDYLEFSMTNIEYDASSEEQWIDIFVTHAYGKDLEMDGLYAVQGAIYYQTEYFEFVKGDTASCYGTLTGNDKNNGEIVADGKFDIPESYDGAYYFTIMSSGNEINPI
ncbi:MAG: hypothetical protein J6A30_03910, partial [Ruminococcus sp.]|nr:hypothetical protein [Ruminococcus sp.]